MQKTILFFIAAGLMLALLSCEKKDEEAGLEIQPDENRLKIAHVNLDTFTTFSSRSDVVKTGKANNSIWLGSIYDDTFGRSTAFIMSQYRLSSDNVDFGTNPQIVSVNAYLDIQSVEGDVALPVQFQIYESTLDINPDSAYNSNLDLSPYVGELAADYTFLSDSLNVMLIPMLNSFGQKILDAEDSVLVDNDKFLSVFKGLYFMVDTNSMDLGSMWSLDLGSSLSYITLEYTNEDADGNIDTNTFNLQFNEHSGRFNQFFHNTAPLDAIWGQDYSKFYLSGIGGVRGHISLSPILTWRDSTQLMIYKAELVVKVDSISNISLPKGLLMEIDNTEDGVQYVDDYLQNVTDNFGGKYDPETGTYSMVITRHIQNLINNNHNDSLLWIYPYSEREDIGSEVNLYTTVSRAILMNGENNETITLKLTYSKLY